jgi:hypothetical protein
MEQTSGYQGTHALYGEWQAALAVREKAALDLARVVDRVDLGNLDPHMRWVSLHLRLKAFRVAEAAATSAEQAFRAVAKARGRK